MLLFHRVAGARLTRNTCRLASTSVTTVLLLPETTLQNCECCQRSTSQLKSILLDGESTSSRQTPLSLPPHQLQFLGYAIQGQHSTSVLIRFMLTCVCVCVCVSITFHQAGSSFQGRNHLNDVCCQAAKLEAADRDIAESVGSTQPRVRPAPHKGAGGQVGCAKRSSNGQRTGICQLARRGFALRTIQQRRYGTFNIGDASTSLFVNSSKGVPTRAL